MKIKPLGGLCLLALSLGPRAGDAALETGYTGAPSAFVFSAYETQTGRTYYRNLDLDYTAFLQNPGGEINLAIDPQFSQFIGKASVRYNVTAFAPLKDDLSNTSTWGVLVTAEPSGPRAEASWVSIDAIRQILQIYYSFLKRDSGVLERGAPGSFLSPEGASALEARALLKSEGVMGTPLPFYFYTNPTGNPTQGLVRKAGEWTLSPEGWLHLAKGSSLMNNQPPKADAGKDQRVIQGQTVTLSGVNSEDPDESPGALKYLWRQTAGPSVSLSSAGGQSISFLAAETGQFEFILTVSDGKDFGTARVSVSSLLLMATIPPSFRRDGTGNTPIRWTVSPAAIKPGAKVVISYSREGSAWQKVGQSVARKAAFAFKPNKKIPDGKGRLRVCVASACDEASVIIQ